MKLLTKAIRAALPPLGMTACRSDPLVRVKFFTPWAGCTWYATEFDGEDRFFGFATLGNPDDAELGYFSLSELESTRGRFGLKIERDMHYSPEPLSRVMAREKGR